MKKLIFIPLVIVLVCALILSGCAGKEPEAKVLKIGVIFGLTGPGSQMQLAFVDIMKMYADWQNEQGGVTVNGEKYLMELIVEDNKNSPAGAVDAATKLVFQDQVKFMAGTVVPVQVDAG